MSDYPIKRPINETDCEQCGAWLHVGAVGFYENDRLFCSEACAHEMRAHDDGLAMQWNETPDL